MNKIRLFKVFMSSNKKRINEVLDSGFVGQGPRVDEFETKLQQLFDTEKRIITVNSCTSALDMCYRLVGLKEGDCVISTPMTCVATNMPLYNNKINILWADVDPKTGLIDIDDVKRKISRKIKAIICVDWCGNSVDYDELRLFDTPIIEDAAHAILTKYKGKHISNAGGDYVCWSFQAIKHLTTGDGGACVVPKDKEEAALKMRWFGFDRTKSESFRCSQDITNYGFKYNMNDISASIGLENIQHVENIVNKHKNNAFYYFNNIRNKHVSLIPFDSSSSYWIYTILVDGKDQFMQYMGKKNIEVSPVHNRNDSYSIFGNFKIKLPGLDKFFSKQIAIPVGWWLTNEERSYVIETINNWQQ